MFDSKKVIFIDAPDPVNAVISVKDGLRNCDEIWLNVKDMAKFEATLFFIRNLNEITTGASTQDIYVITPSAPPRLYTKVYFIYNLDRQLAAGTEDQFYLWNLDQSMDVDKAIKLGYRRFFSTKIFNKQVTNIYNNSNVLHVPSEFHYNFLPFVEGLDGN